MLNLNALLFIKLTFLTKMLAVTLVPANITNSTTRRTTTLFSAMLTKGVSSTRLTVVLYSAMLTQTRTTAVNTVELLLPMNTLLYVKSPYFHIIQAICTVLGKPTFCNVEKLGGQLLSKTTTIARSCLYLSCHLKVS